MAVDKDLEAFVDFLQERGVPVLQSLGQVDLDHYDASAEGGGIAANANPVTARAETSALDTPSPLQPTITKEAVVSKFLRYINEFGSKGLGCSSGGGDPVGGGAEGDTLAEEEQQQQQQLLHDRQQHQIQQQNQHGITSTLPLNSSSSGHLLRDLPPHPKAPPARSAKVYAAVPTAGVNNAAGTSLRSGDAVQTRSASAVGEPTSGNGRDAGNFGRPHSPAPRTCQQSGCSRRPSFNHPGLRARFCSSHRELNMVDVAHKARCQHRHGCNKHPGYGYAGMKPTHCSGHRLADMVDRKRSRKIDPASAKVRGNTGLTAVAIAAAAAAVSSETARAVAQSLGSGGGADGGSHGGSEDGAERGTYGSPLFGSPREAPPVPATGAVGGGVGVEGLDVSDASLAGLVGGIGFERVGAGVSREALLSARRQGGVLGTKGDLGPGGMRTGAVAAVFGAGGSDPPSAAGEVRGVEDVSRRRRRYGKRKRPWKKAHCEDEECFKGPSFGAAGTPPLRCSLHKVAGDVYVKNQCVHAGCSKVCSFGPCGERPQYCAAHRTGDMVDVKSKVCAEAGCDKRSSFGEVGMSPRFCAKHRPHGMVDVVHRRCEAPLCQRHPTYGYKGQRRRFCAQHVLPGMVDLLKVKRPACRSGAEEHKDAEEDKDAAQEAEQAKGQGTLYRGMRSLPGGDGGGGGGGGGGAKSFPPRGLCACVACAWSARHDTKVRRQLYSPPAPTEIEFVARYV